MPCSNSVISGVTEAERYLLPLTLHQSLMVFPVRISLLLRSYYITNLGLDSNQHRHLAQCLRSSVIYLSTTWYSAEPSATQAQWASNPHLLSLSARHHCRQSPSHGVLGSNQQGVVDQPLFRHLISLQIVSHLRQDDGKNISILPLSSYAPSTEVIASITTDPSIRDICLLSTAPANETGSRLCSLPLLTILLSQLDKTHSISLKRRALVGLSGTIADFKVVVLMVTFPVGKSRWFISSRTISEVIIQPDT